MEKISEDLEAWTEKIIEDLEAWN